MKSNEFDKALVALERSVPADLAEAASEIFWAACLIGVDQRLAKAVAALIKSPDMSTGQLMKAAGVTSGTATRARTGLRIVGRDKLPPAPPKAEPAPDFDFAGVAAPEPPPAATEPMPEAPQKAAEPEILPPASKVAGKQKLNGTAILPPVEPAPEPAAPATPPPSIGTRSAERLLKSLLRKRPRSATDVRLAAERADISPRVLQAAAAALGVEENAFGEWRLPAGSRQ